MNQRSHIPTARSDRYRPAGNDRRLAVAVFFSLLVHAFLLSLQFGLPGLGLPGLELPWNQRRPQPVELSVVLSAARQAPDVAPPAEVERAPEPAEMAPDKPVASAQPTDISERSHAAATVARATVHLAPVETTEPQPQHVASKASSAKDPANSSWRPHERVAPASTGARPRLITKEDSGQGAFAVPPPALDEPGQILAPKAEVRPEIAESPAPAPVMLPAPDVQSSLEQEQRLAEEEAAQRTREAEAKAREDQRLAQELEARRSAEALQARQKREAEESARREQELQAKKQEELKGQEEARAERLAREAEARRRAEEAAALQAATMALQKQAEQKRLEEESARRAREREARKREELRQREEASAKREAMELEVRRQAEEEARRQAALQQKQAEEMAAKERAAADARRQAEEEVRRQAALRQKQAEEVAARERAEAEARRQAEAAARQREQALAEKSRAAEMAALARNALGGSPAGKEQEKKGDDMHGALPNQHQASQPPDPSRRRSILGRVDQDVGLMMYVESWRLKIERNGRLNYKQSLVETAYTEPVVTVAVRSDGSIEDIAFHRSSGRPELDEAVRRIIRLNARYAAFPPELARRYDVIEIRRVWNFDGQLRLLDEVR